MKLFLALLGVCSFATAAVVACGGNEATPCSTWQDCQTAAEAEELRPCDSDGQGATIHVNTQCVEGRCKAECASTCIPYGFGCAGEGRVCETPPGIAPSSVVHSCMKNPIVCTTAAECPLEKPSESGEWTCESGFCRFPGFTYAFE